MKLHLVLVLISAGSTGVTEVVFFFHVRRLTDKLGKNNVFLKTDSTA